LRLHGLRLVASLGQIRDGGAGRSQEKLDAVNASLGSRFATLVGDVADAGSMEQLCKRGTRGIVGIVGV
jgi:hypothetical protein